MVGQVGSPTCIVHADMTLTQSKVKVKVTGLSNFPKLHFFRSLSSAILVDHDSMGPSLEPVRAQFLNFLLRKLSREFKLCGMSILH